MIKRASKKTKPSKAIKRRPSRHAARSAVSKAMTLRVPANVGTTWKLNDEQVTLIKNTVAKGASDHELQLFLTTCRRHRLDPFTHQIWFVRRWDKNADSGRLDTKGNPILGAHVGVTQVGIDGLLHVAARDHKDFGSVSQIEYGPMMEITSENRKMRVPEFAIAKVWKKGMPEPTVGEAYWEEYAPNDLGKAPFWKKMPRRMLGKCAVALAIRQAYPDLSGVYIPEECAEMQEDYTPSGRKIVQQEPENKYLDKYKERESEQLKKLSPEQREVVERRMEESSAKALGYKFHPESKTWEIKGSRDLKIANQDMLGDFWNPTSRTFVIEEKDAVKLGALISVFETRGVPFKNLDAREPGVE